MTKTTKTISFDTERDADLLAWLDAHKNTSEAVRNALRGTIKPGVTLDEVYRAVKALERKVGSGPVVVQSESVAADAPGTEAAGEALDSLGL